MLPGCRVVKIIVRTVIAFSMIFCAGMTAVQADVYAEVKAAPPVSKPRPPISITLTPLTDVVPGQPVDFEVQVTAYIDATIITIQAALPAGSVVHSGVLGWQGGMLRDQVRTLNFRVTLPRQSAEPVIVDAAIGELATAHFSDRAIFQTPQDSALAAAVAGSTSRTVMRKGVRVEEHVLR